MWKIPSVGEISETLCTNTEEKNSECAACEADRQYVNNFLTCLAVSQYLVLECLCTLRGLVYFQ